MAEDLTGPSFLWQHLLPQQSAPEDQRPRGHPGPDSKKVRPAILRALRVHGPQTVPELAARLGYNRPRVQESVARMLKNGEVRRLVDEVTGSRGKPVHRVRVEFLADVQQDRPDRRW
jgi:MarR family